MAVADAMFIFEVVVEHVKSLVESRLLVIRSDFADIFSLELKDPKQMHIVIPDPPPLPPEPPGKGKKKKPPKPKKPKKGALPPPPPPEPVIQSGQSVLFTSSAEFLIKLMAKCPLEVTLWSKEDNLVYIGSSIIPWDPIFPVYLDQILKCQTPPSVTLNDEFNVFEETGTGQLMAKIGLQVKLSYLGDKVTTSFRTLSEDPAIKKYLYTGINSKTTSYICTMKTTDEVFEENCNKIENSFTKDHPKAIMYADYTNAPGANLAEFSEGDYCCINNADRPPDSKYQAPNTIPNIDFIIDYVRKIVASCNDNMRMLTPRPTIRPRVRATDIDRLCYCKQSQWPESALAQMYKKEVQASPCAVCAESGMKGKKGRDGPGATFDVANIRGPCGKPDCKIARHIRKYIESLIEEDNVEINIDDIIGPCGSKLCTLAEKIQEFLRHEGVFTKGSTGEGLSTQCTCIQKMQDALAERDSCQTICSKDCEQADDDDPEDSCAGKGCPFAGPSQPLVYDVYYFTVEHDRSTPSETSSGKTSGKSTPVTSDTADSKFKYCGNECPTMKASTEVTLCTKSVCPAAKTEDKSCPEHPCPIKGEFPPSPADSHIEIVLDDIHNPCCSTTCDVAETVKDFIVDGLASKKKNENDPCYCDCECDFNFTKKTTYCAVCGGYECLGTDMENQPDYIKPLACPIYHKLYDKKYIETENPWPDDNEVQTDTISIKSMKGQRRTQSGVRKESSVAEQGDGEKVKRKTGKEKKKAWKSVASVVKKEGEEKPKPSKYPYPPVPANMGWNWTAEDIPGMKVSQGWKPGAVSKVILRKLKRAKLRSAAVVNNVPVKKSKKKCGDEPTLVISKKEGEYTVEMKVTDENEQNCRLYDPLIYKIASANHDEKIKRRQRKARRLIRNMIKEFNDPFHPENCQETCLRSYKEAVGIFDEISEIKSDTHLSADSCSEDGQESDESSLDVDWEIQFSPPNARGNS